MGRGERGKLRASLRFPPRLPLVRWEAAPVAFSLSRIFSNERAVPFVGSRLRCPVGVPASPLAPFVGSRPRRPWGSRIAPLFSPLSGLSRWLPSVWVI